ncbi:MAG: glycosyltransferase family 4 protein [Deltaproteobacteria bacterium]|nr:glycosyltransferase family 4 protein [Deltaproteobacteria bacterium]
MRILHLCSYSLYSGPIPATLGLALAQQQLGHTVYLGYDRKRGAFNDYEEAAAPWIEPRALTPPRSLTLSAKSSPLEYVHDLVGLRALYRAVDVVHLHLSHDHTLAALAGKPFRLPLVRTLHSARSVERRFGQRWLHSRVDGLIVRCAAHRELLRQRFGIESAGVRVIKGSIDAARFEPASAAARLRARARFELPADAPVLCHVALIAGRGQEELVAAVKLLGARAPRVLFVGRGEGEAALRRAVDAAGVGTRVRFAGYLQGEALLDAYAAADAAFLAVPGNDASMRAALEAMASALPLIAVTEDALGELCSVETGFPLQSRDPAAIAAGLSAWLESGGAARARGLAGRAAVERERTFASEARATLAFYDSLLTRGRVA